MNWSFSCLLLAGLRFNHRRFYQLLCSIATGCHDGGSYVCAPFYHSLINEFVGSTSLRLGHFLVYVNTETGSRRLGVKTSRRCKSRGSLPLNRVERSLEMAFSTDAENVVEIYIPLAFLVNQRSWTLQ